MRFEGDFDHLWRIGHRPPIRRLTWDWWWWLIMLDGGSGPDAQVMALWSTKDTPSIDVNGRPWSSEGRPRSTATRQVLSGQVCAWYFDGEQMHEPLIQTPCRMAALTDQDPSWGSSGIGSGGGAVVPLVDQDLSMGLASDRSSFWLNLQAPFDDGLVVGPRSMRFRIEPWTDVLSTLRPRRRTTRWGWGMTSFDCMGRRSRAPSMDAPPKALHISRRFASKPQLCLGTGDCFTSRMALTSTGSSPTYR